MKIKERNKTLRCTLIIISWHDAIKRETIITLPNSSKSYGNNEKYYKKERKMKRVKKKKKKKRETHVINQHVIILSISFHFSFTLGIIRNLGVWLSWFAGFIDFWIQRTRNKEELSFFVGRKTYIFLYEFLYEFNL